MIFVTLGSQKFQFNRLLKKIDELVADKSISEEVFAQIGYSDYKPKNYRYKEFISRDEFNDYQTNANIIITHGGTGAIIGAVKKGKKVIAIPRLEQYGEHVDDHQIQLIEQFSEMNLIIPCYDLEKFTAALLDSENMKKIEYVSNTDKYIQDIENFIISGVRK